MKNGVWRPPSSLDRTYTSALNFLWGVMLLGAARTWPRSTSSRFVPRASADVVAGLALIEQLAEHLTPVQVVFTVDGYPRFRLLRRP